LWMEYLVHIFLFFSLWNGSIVVVFFKDLFQCHCTYIDYVAVSELWLTQNSDWLILRYCDSFCMEELRNIKNTCWDSQPFGQELYLELTGTLYYSTAEEIHKNFKYWWYNSCLKT
jgi:hypothetical protein